MHARVEAYSWIHLLRAVRDGEIVTWGNGNICIKDFQQRPFQYCRMDFQLLTYHLPASVNAFSPKQETAADRNADESLCWASGEANEKLPYAQPA